jgi:hypothetical protein
MKKLIISAIIASLLIPVTAFGAFSDVNSSTDYNNAIQWMTDNGVIDGYPDGSFQPDRCVNRVEMLKMLFLANQTELYSQEGTAGSHYYDDFFSDTDTNEWYWPYLNTALRNGVVEGYSDGTFKPSQCVNRVEAIKMAILEFNDGQIPSYEEGLWSFADVNRSEWYGQYIVPALFNNLLGTQHMTTASPSSVEGANFYPGDSMTRKEVAEMLYRMKAVRDNGAEKYSTSIIPSAIIQITETNNYTNSEFDLSFDIPSGWSITEEAEVPQGDLTQLRVTLRPNNNGNVAVSINTPPIETGYPGLTIEDGFDRNINGLTLQNSVLMSNDETGILISKDSYYKNESDWSSHIEFLFSAPQGTNFDGYLPDYYKVLDSIVY